MYWSLSRLDLYCEKAETGAWKVNRYCWWGETSQAADDVSGAGNTRDDRQYDNKTLFLCSV